MDDLFPKNANFECLGKPITDPDRRGVPQDFGFDFELEGNFTFTWALGLESVGMNLLCAEHFLFIKELVRRTHFGAIAVFIDPDRVLKLNGSDESFDPQLSYILSNEVDISVDYYALHHLFMSFVNISLANIGPSVAIMGGLYPNTNSNPLFGIIRIFKTFTWVLIFLTTISISLILTTDLLLLVQKNNHKKSKYYKIKLFGQQYWTVWNALFMQTFHFKHFSRNSYLLLIGILLMTKLFIINFFSSQILSITIENPYSVINSAEDVNKFEPELQPLLFVPETEIDGIQSVSEVKSLVTKALDEKRENYLKLPYDFEALFDEINLLINNISLEQTHVLLASEGDLEIIIKLNPVQYKEMTHISESKYFDKMSGIVVNKNANKTIAKIFKDIVFQCRETGLSSKSLEAGLREGYDVYCDKEFVFDIKENALYMELDEMKIALGPYMVGISLSVLIFVLEYLDDFEEEKEKGMNKPKKIFKKVPRKKVPGSRVSKRRAHIFSSYFVVKNNSALIKNSRAYQTKLSPFVPLVWNINSMHN